VDPGRRPTLGIILCLGLLALATLAATWPLPVRLGTHLPGNLGHPGLQGDVFFQWNLHRQMEEGGIDHLRSSFTHYPEGEELRAKVAFSLHLGLYVVLMLFCDLITAHNLAVLLILYANGVAAWLLLRERTRSATFAVCGAVLFALGPFVQLKLDQGFVQKITLFHLPLFALFLLRAAEGRRVRDALLAATFLTVGLLVYPPFAAFDLLLAMPLVANALGRRAGRGRLLPLLLTLAVVTLGLLAMLWVVGREDFVQGDPMPLSFEQFRSQGGYLDLTRPFRCFPYLGTFPDRPFQAFNETLPLGLPILPLLLAGWAACVGRRAALWLLLLTAALTVLMAGPYLLHSGEPVLIDGRPVPLPLLLVEALPFSQALRFPIRLYPWLQLALLLAAGEAVSWLGSRAEKSRGWARAARLLPAALGLLVVVEPLLVFPEYRRLRVEELRPSQYCAVARERGARAALHLPYFAPGPHDYLMAAVLCDQAIVNPWSWRPPAIDIPAPDAGKAARERFIGQLAEHRVGVIVVHPVGYAYYDRHPEAPEPSLGQRELGFGGADVEAWLERALGPPQALPADGVLVYRVSLPDSGDATLSD